MNIISLKIDLLPTSLRKTIFQMHTVRIVILLLAAFFSCHSVSAFPTNDDPSIPTVERFKIDVPSFVLKGIDFRAEITALDSSGSIVHSYDGTPSINGLSVRVDGKRQPIEAAFENGTLILPNAVAAESGILRVIVADGPVITESSIRSIPGLLSILPPLLAIGLAIFLRQVVISLFAGIWIGAFIIFDYNIVGGAFRVLDHFALNAITEPSHTMIIMFTMLFGGLIGVISQNGGTLGIANLITRYARTSRGGQFSTWLLSLMIFFDDYANVLIRGNLMRPITDKLKISREKLAFIVDTGAASVASIFLISTWIGYEVGLIESALRGIGWPEDGYSVFIQTIPYRFYPIMAMLLVLVIALTGRDFGPMLKAERRAFHEGKPLRDGAQPAQDLTKSTEFLAVDKPARWYNGLVPVLTVIVVACYGLYYTGMQTIRADGEIAATLGNIISNADSYTSLIWASLSGCLMAIILTVGQGIMKLGHAVEAWFGGLKAMLLAVLILTLAWSIGAVTEELRTADYLVQILRGSIAPHWMPVLTFIIASVMAFATGTSWGTMAIMMPIVIPLGFALGVDAGLTQPQVTNILYGTISSVLAGAVFGDHCSPISDTTILSSMASASDHIDHVRTQLPYALVAAFIGMIIGDIPTAFGVPAWISLIVGAGAVIAVVTIFGKKVERLP
jgi:Na+/H+ antiporter NhaC